MTQKELIKKIEYLNELEQMLEEVKAEADTIKDELKQVMIDRDLNEMEAGQYIVRYTDVLSNRFDTTGFKKIYGELYKAFTKQVSSKRFSISC